MSKEENKKLAQKTKKSLEELGYKISLGHCYELISKIAGYPNWDTACAANVTLLVSGKPEEKLMDKEVLEAIEHTKKQFAMFTPSTPEDLKKRLKKVVYGYFKEEDGTKTAKRISEKIIKAIETNSLDSDVLFEMWDSLGVSRSPDDLELDLVYALAGQCWSSRVPGVVERRDTADYDLENLFCDSLNNGFDLKKHCEFVEKRTLENKQNVFNQDETQPDIGGSSYN